MRRLLSIVAAVLCATVAYAQTPEEILEKMSEVMDAREAEGMAMDVSIRIPLLGTLNSRTWTLGDNVRIDTDVKGVTMIIWSDGKTQWEYDSKSNELVIKDDSGDSSDSGDAEMFEGIADGYDLTLKSETPTEWYIHCKKSKTNKEKDDPKNMDIVVYKDTYMPKSLSAKMSGTTMTMSNISYGVTLQQVTFDPSKYPDAKIIDKRGEGAKAAQ